ncbi:MAG: hypothetical protein DID92_2727743362 [Candidatus Nitrotoga sp. SPKER]|nr:MAG: hypothetical protein DID92_2727743362 [Candidatus Nitrotoga sp. SPKER]
MKGQKPYGWYVRVSWPLLGGMWGAWLGFGSYFHLPHNANSFGTFFASGFFIFFAGVGLVAGAALGALIGGLAEWLLRRSGAGIVAALSVATLVNMLTLWQISDFVQAKYPGLRADSGTKTHHSNKTGAFTPSDKGSQQKPCSGPVPTNTRERANWDTECR